MILELKSLGQEVTENTRSRLLKLEKENQRLLKSLEELQGTSHPLNEFISKSKHIEEQWRTSNHSLDTENLHASMENNNSNLHCLEVEIHELEVNNQSLQVNANQNQGQVNIENKGLVHENGHLERDRSCLEKDNRRLLQQVKIQEASLDSSSLKLAVLEKENRTLIKKTTYLSEASVKNKELEMENQELIHQAGVDKRMLVTLREVTTATNALQIVMLSQCFLI